LPFFISVFALNGEEMSFLSIQVKEYF